MDNIKIELLHYTPKEILIEAMSMPYKTDNFRSMFTKETMKKIKAICVDKKHSSVLEHITFNFKIEGISRLCLQELIRHRLVSYTVESTRYTLLKKEEVSELIKRIKTGSVDNIVNHIIKKYVVIPNYIETEKENKTIYEAILINFKAFLESLDFYNRFISEHKDKVKYFLPESWRTNLVMSINIRSLRNFLQLRLFKQAHFEIRHLANLIIEQIPEEYKILFEDLNNTLTK